MTVSRFPFIQGSTESCKTSTEQASTGETNPQYCKLECLYCVCNVNPVKTKPNTTARKLVSFLRDHPVMFRGSVHLNEGPFLKVIPPNSNRTYTEFLVTFCVLVVHLIGTCMHSEIKKRGPHGHTLLGAAVPLVRNNSL